MSLLEDFFSQLASGWFAERSERGLAANANRRRPGDPPPTSVKNGPTSITLAVICCVIFCAPFAILVALSIALGELFVTPLMFVLFATLAIMSLIGLWDEATRRIDWDADSVRFRNWNSDRTVPWNDIVGVEEKSWPPHLRVAFRDGKGFRISETMKGSRHFLSLIDNRWSHAPPEGRTKRQRRRRKKR